MPQSFGITLIEARTIRNLLRYSIIAYLVEAHRALGLGAEGPVPAPSSEPDYWFVTPIVALVGVLVGGALVVWQTGRTQRIGSSLQREKAREELKLELYARIRTQIDAIHAASDCVTSYVSFLPATYRVYANFVADGIEPAPIRKRGTELLDLT